MERSSDPLLGSGNRMNERARIKFQCRDADLHAKQARLAGIEASGGLGKEDIYLVMAWPPYHSAFLLSDLTLVRKSKRDWPGTAETVRARDHWCWPCEHSSGRLQDLTSRTHRGKSRLGSHPAHRPTPSSPTRYPNQAEKPKEQCPCCAATLPTNARHLSLAAEREGQSLIGPQALVHRQ